MMNNRPSPSSGNGSSAATSSEEEELAPEHQGQHQGRIISHQERGEMGEVNRNAAGLGTVSSSYATNVGNNLAGINSGLFQQSGVSRSSNEALIANLLGVAQQQQSGTTSTTTGITNTIASGTDTTNRSTANTTEELIQQILLQQQQQQQLSNTSSLLSLASSSSNNNNPTAAATAATATTTDSTTTGRLPSLLSHSSPSSATGRTLFGSYSNTQGQLQHPNPLFSADAQQLLLDHSLQSQRAAASLFPPLSSITNDNSNATSLDDTTSTNTTALLQSLSNQQQQQQQQQQSNMALQQSLLNNSLLEQQQQQIQQALRQQQQHGSTTSTLAAMTTTPSEQDLRIQALANALLLNRTATASTNPSSEERSEQQQLQQTGQKQQPTVADEEMKQSTTPPPTYPQQHASDTVFGAISAASRQRIIQDQQSQSQSHQQPSRIESGIAQAIRASSRETLTSSTAGAQSSASATTVPDFQVVSHSKREKKLGFPMPSLPNKATKSKSFKISPACMSKYRRTWQRLSNHSATANTSLGQNATSSFVPEFFLRSWTVRQRRLNDHMYRKIHGLPSPDSSPNSNNNTNNNNNNKGSK